MIIWIEKSLSAAQTGSFSLFCAEKSRRAMLCGFSYTIRSSVLRFSIFLTRKTKRNEVMRRYFAVKNYLASFAALIASIIIGTTLNRSPQMP